MTYRARAFHVTQYTSVAPAAASATATGLAATAARATHAPTKNRATYNTTTAEL